MNEEQKIRYSRHILLKDLGYEGQDKIANSHVLVIGAGGLGSPATMVSGLRWFRQTDTGR